MVQEQQGGTASANLLSGLGIDEPLSRAGATYLTDALGSTVALVNGGVVKTSYGYDPYGSTNVSGTASTNAHQFTGRENDDTGLYAYRNRYYNPAWARFVSKDPIGLAGGINLYAYANNNPIQLRDPFGYNPAAGDQTGGSGAAQNNQPPLPGTPARTGPDTAGTPPGGPDEVPPAGNLKEATQRDLMKAAERDGYTRVEDWKTQELQLNSRDQILKDQSGNLYSVPRQGGGTPQPLNVQVPR